METGISSGLMGHLGLYTDFICHMSGNGQGKNSSRSGKGLQVSLESGTIDNVKKSQKIENI